MKFNQLVIVLLLLSSSFVKAQIRIIDFDQAKFVNGEVLDKVAKWKTTASLLSHKEIDGTPSLVLKSKSSEPFATAESGVIEGGCKYLSFDYKRLDLDNCEVIVWVNDQVVATIDQTNGQTQSIIKLPIFMAGKVRFKFQQQSEKSGSIAIDNILWTPCSEEEATAYANEHKLTPLPGNLIFLGDFESGNLDNFSMAGNHRNRIVTTPVRAGKYALRSMVDRYDDDVNFRCEIVAKQQNTRQNYMYQDIGKEYWYGLSTYLPKNFTIDNQPEIIFQFHSVPDVGEPWLSPNVGMEILDNHYELGILWDSHYISSKDKSKLDGQLNYPFGNVTADMGKWTDWVVNVKWDYSKDGDGFLKIWKDGVLILDRKGPNCFNDAVGPFLRFGIYKWPWKHTELDRPSNTTNRVMYHDEFKIGNSKASYQEVSPGGLSPTGTIDLIDKIDKK